MLEIGVNNFKKSLVANGKLYVVGADFEERFCRSTKMLEKGAEATNKAAHRTAIYKLLCPVVIPQCQKY